MYNDLFLNIEEAFSNDGNELTIELINGEITVFVKNENKVYFAYIVGESNKDFIYFCIIYCFKNSYKISICL